MRASLRQSTQVASQRSGTSVAVRADEQFAPNRPIFNAFALYIVTRPRIEPFWAAMAASCIAILGLLLDLSDPALTLRPLSTILRGSKNRPKETPGTREGRHAQMACRCDARLLHRRRDGRGLSGAAGARGHRVRTGRHCRHHAADADAQARAGARPAIRGREPDRSG